MNKNIYKPIVLTTLAITGLALIYLMVTSRTPPDTKTETPAHQNKKTYRYAKPSQRIRGFQYDGYEASHHLLSIRSSQVTIRRKKMGFVRFALIKEALFEEGHIKLYMPVDPQTAINPDTDGIADPAGLQRALGLMTSKDSKLLSNFKNVSSILIRPVIIEMYNDNRLATSISGGSCAISLTRRNIIFTGSVIVISGNRKLMLDRLALNPENTLLTGTDYVLYTPKGKTAGKQITTDLSLQKGFE
ncbi:hypothetical protein [Desulfobacula sp.]|uniref:hypothetical protein n=1 Tax=Desulfobacula sp. TaxID=2593537 RepID=UPI00260AEA54|nr:hypothetical protein [Desulfobacula sp.]